MRLRGGGTSVFPLLLAVLSSGVCYVSSSSGECEVCDLKQDLELTNNELDRCRERLAKLEEGTSSSSSSGSYLDKVCNWVASPGREGKSVMKRTVDAFLRSTRLDQASLEPGEGSSKQVHLTVTLSPEELLKLRRFLLTDEGDVEEMQGIISSSYSLTSPSGIGGGFQRINLSFLGDFLLHESFVICQIVVVSALVGLALWRKVRLWRVAVLVAVSSVAWTWVHLYKVALSRKQVTLRRLEEVPQRCLVEKQGWWGAVSGAVSGALGLASSSGDRRCEAYYEALMVDPFWEVTPLKALTETVSQMVLRPLEMCGASMGVFFSEVLAPLPLLWKVPVLVVCAVAVLLLMLMACRYSVKSPLLFSIEPSQKPKSTKKRKTSSSVAAPEALPYPTTPNQIDHIEDSAVSGGNGGSGDTSHIRRSPWTFSQLRQY